MSWSVEFHIPYCVSTCVHSGISFCSGTTETTVAAVSRTNMLSSNPGTYPTVSTEFQNKNYGL